MPETTTTTTPAATAPVMGLMTVKDVAQLLSCSTRTVYRLNDAGRLPHPVRLGTLLRWPRSAIEAWIAEGCPKPDRSGR